MNVNNDIIKSIIDNNSSLTFYNHAGFINIENITSFSEVYKTNKQIYNIYNI